MSQSMPVAVDERGYRIGGGHHNAKIDDHDVDLVRALHEDHGVSYSELSEKFGVSKSLIAQICRYEVRCATPHRWKFVRVTDRFLLCAANGRWGFRREVLK